MAINRQELVTRHNPHLNAIEYKSPFTVGNGEFAFTADITGLQTLYEEYKEKSSPLCTMSQTGWHSTPVSKDRNSYSLNDVNMTEYDYAGRTVTYAVEKQQGNEEVYFWLRQNPHRLNLGRLGFLYNQERILPEHITEISQTLHLYEGILDSSFKLHGVACRVKTCVQHDTQTLAVQVESELLSHGLLTVMLAFPYGSPDISASDWNSPDRHESKVDDSSKDTIILKHSLDQTTYYAGIRFDHDFSIRNIEEHKYLIKSNQKNTISFTITFTNEKITSTPTVEQTMNNSRAWWKCFWEKGGIVDLHRSKDPRATELERRIVLSQYQSAIQSCGSMPPQETGLTCNSWHGKFHLEMYFWHLGYLPLWNRTELLEPSLDWYLLRLPEARENAARNGFKGAKWPKQVAYDGIDSPSPIATLLIWQQPHIIYMLELLYQNRIRSELSCIQNDPEKKLDEKLDSASVLKKYWCLVKETADYMVDLAVYNKTTGKYDLVPPVIPAQEAHDSRITLNPIFEVEYWRFTLRMAAKWAERLGKNQEAEKWVEVAVHMAELPVKDGKYLAHQNCPRTYEEFNKDHPMMTAVYGLINSDRVDEKIMFETLKNSMECWNYDTMWGWDFAMMAMTATRLGLPELAIELLLKDTANNHYVKSGNNSQKLREDLPLYLPGNGSLLLAVAMMTAGYTGCKEVTPGFPKNGLWEVEYEEINPFSY